MRASLRFIAECCAQASGRRAAVFHDPSIFNRLAAPAPLTFAPAAMVLWCRHAASIRARQFGPQNAKALVFDGRYRRLRNRTMHRPFPLCALPLVLTLLAGPALAQAEDPANDEAALELPADASLDLSTPEFEPGKLTPTAPFAEKPPASDWAGKVGIDYSKPAIPAVTFQPEQLLAGAVPDQSTGVAWATITAPGFEAPLGWDKTSIETRVDPAQEQSKLGTTLSRSVPIDDSVSLTADISSTDDKWLRTLSAEQKLFGGPFSLTGSVSETATGDLSKSLKAGFKRTW